MIPKSAIPGVVWPAIPDAAGAMLLAILRQLDESEWLPAVELEQRQTDALTRVLRHASETVAYYRDRPDYAAIAEEPALTADDWRLLPVLTRADVQGAGTTLRSEALPKAHLPVAEVMTAGSTGPPVKALATAVTDLFWQAITLREQLWHERDLSGKLAAIRADLNGEVPPSGIALESWGPSTGSVYRTGPCHLFSVRYDVAAQAEWLIAEDPDYLLTYPSNLAALARHFADAGSRLPRLRQACTYGEVLSDHVRALCRRAWGVEVVDLYSTQELGYLALQCPRTEQYHVQAESVYLEVLDDDGQPCLPGEIGRVVATSLHNFAMPLIRYDLGDYAVVGPPCACGRGLPVLSAIIGRERNRWTMPQGERIWPLFSSREWAHIEAIRQLQLVQHRVDEVEARIVGSRPLTTDEEAELTSRLRRRFDYPLKLSFTYLDDVARTDGHKFEDFVSLVTDPDEASESE